MTHNLWVSVSLGAQRLWDGPIEKMPWWWPFVLQIEKRCDGLRETSAYDYEHKPPPRDLWPISRSDDLEDYLTSRRKEGEEQSRNGGVLD